MNYFIGLFLVFNMMVSAMAADLPSMYQNKPKGMKCLVWLQQLEEGRDKADLIHDFPAFETITREISATLAGKYGFAKRSATPEERQAMLSAVLKTRTTFTGKPDILNDFYFGYDRAGCRRKTESDEKYKRHMGVIAAADAICWAAGVDRPLYDKKGQLDQAQRAQEVFEESFRKQRKLATVEPKFVETVTQTAMDLHADEDSVLVKELLKAVPGASWKRLVDEAGSIGDIMAPQLNFLDMYTNDFSAFEDKGWTGHKMGQFSTWVRADDEDLQASKQGYINIISENPKRFQNFTKALLQPMTPRAVLLTRANKQLFKDMPSDVPFDGTTVAVEYRLFHPPLNSAGGFVALPDLSFYLTRKLSSPSLKTLLSYLDPNAIKERAKYCGNILSRLNRLYFDKYFLHQLDPFSWGVAWATLGNDGSLVAINNSGTLVKELMPLKSEQKYKTAADRGFSPALRNYSFLLRDKGTDPIQTKLYLKMAQMFGEFSAPDNNFASGLFFEPPDLEGYFSKVISDKQPHCIKLKKSLRVTGGDLHIHFRDANHLRYLIEQTPYLNADGIFFILDQNVRNGLEFVHTSGVLKEEDFVHIMADEPLTFSGEMSLPYHVVLPQGSSFNGLSISHSGRFSSTLSGYREGLFLANIIDNFDKNTLISRTREAKLLYSERTIDREEYPEKYPDFDTLTPEGYLWADEDVIAVNNDYLESSSPIIYMGSSISSIGQLQREFKSWEGNIFFVNPALKTAGVYSLDLFTLRTGFRLITQGNMLITGIYDFEDKYFEIATPGVVWNLCSKINTWDGGASIYASEVYKEIGCSKPANMPPQVWQNFKSFALRQYGIRLGD